MWIYVVVQQFTRFQLTQRIAQFLSDSYSKVLENRANPRNVIVYVVKWWYCSCCRNVSSVLFLGQICHDISQVFIRHIAECRCILNVNAAFLTASLSHGKVAMHHLAILSRVSTFICALRHHSLTAPELIQLEDSHSPVLYNYDVARRCIRLLTIYIVTDISGTKHVYISVSVCLLAYLKNHMAKLHKFFWHWRYCVPATPISVRAQTLTLAV